MKRLSAAVAIFFILFTHAPGCFAAETQFGFNLSPIQCRGNSDGELKVYFKGEYINNGSDSVTAEVTAEVKNADGKCVQSISDSVVVKPNTVVYKDIAPIVEESGVYKIEGTVTAGQQVFEISEDFVNGVINDNLGVCTHFGLSSRVIEHKDIFTARQGAIGWIRDECFWANVEKKKGEYKIPEDFINAVNYTKSHAMNVLLILNYGNTLYTPEVNYFPKTDEEIDAYASYCGFMARELKGKVDHFEIWNEPNTVRYSGREITAAEYVKVLKRAYNAIKEENPDAYVLGGAIAASANCNDFLRGIFEEGAAQYMDALSIHPYIYAQIPNDSNKFSFANMDFQEEIMLEKAGRTVPIWITECGFANTIPDMSNEESKKEAEAENVLTEEQQGAYNVRNAVYYGADSRVEKVFLYELMDKPNNGLPDPTMQTYNYGITNYAGKPKAAYNMLAFANTMIGGTVLTGEETYLIPVSDTGKEGVGYRFYKFSGADRDVIVMWTIGGAQYKVNAVNDGDEFKLTWSDDGTAIINTASDKKYISAYDSYGNEANISNLTIDYSPKYIVCRKKSQTAYDTECRINTDGGNISVAGRTRSGFCPVSLRIISGESEYINQTISDTDGWYSFSFETDKSGIYAIYINDTGDLHNFTAYADKSKLTLWKNGESINDLSGVVAGDEITARIELGGNPPPDGRFIGAVFDSELILTNAETAKLVSDGKTAAAELKLTIDSPDASLRFFVWGENMTPLINSKRIE